MQGDMCRLPLLLALVGALLLSQGASAFVGPSTSPPGGLDPSDTPMFILFTHDDAVLSSTHEAMKAVTDGRASLDGCPATATMFTLVSGNDCELMVDLYNSGYEIADHTMTHGSIKGISSGDLDYEVVEARKELAACGIPESDIVGLRAPFLETDADVREVMYNAGFLYESSLIEPITGASLSSGQGGRVWPFQMDEGVPMNCDFFAGTQECSTSESWPGMWQVPVWWLTSGGTDGTPYSMDYGDGGDAFDILKENFDAAYYEGNRAPLPIFIHTPWLEDSSNLKGVKKFVDYALSQPNVYMVTMRQLIAWMQNPIPASQLTPEALGCGTPGGAGPSASSSAPSMPTPTLEAPSSPSAEEEGEGQPEVEQKEERSAADATSGSDSGTATGTDSSSSTGGGSSVQDRLAALSSGRRLLRI